MKYIVKNCPSCWYIYCDKEYECNFRGSGITKPCKERTDCLMKQIVKKCNGGINKVLYDGDFIKVVDRNKIASEIMNLLDIEECE